MRPQKRTNRRQLPTSSICKISPSVVKEADKIPAQRSRRFSNQLLGRDSARLRRACWAGCTRSSTASRTSLEQPQPLDFIGGQFMNEQLRALFPITRSFNYLNHAAVSPPPTPTIAAVESQLRDVNANGSLHYREWVATKERARQLVATMIGARAEQVAFLTLPMVYRRLVMVCAGGPATTWSRLATSFRPTFIPGAASATRWELRFAYARNVAGVSISTS